MAASEWPMPHRIPPSTAPTAVGFTLFEIAVSLAILAVAILAVLLVYPIGLKAQQLARFRVVAATKALELIDVFARHEHMWWDRQIEAAENGRNTFIPAVPVDLERMMSAANAGLIPLPPIIARRFDAPGDEIQRLLDDGGSLFFTAPLSYEGAFDNRIAEWIPPTDTPLEAQALVWAVVGYAQQNNLPNHPCLAWPYQEWWPMPLQAWEHDWWQTNAGGGAHVPTPWPAKLAEEKVFLIANGDSFDQRGGGGGVCDDAAQCALYLIAAQELVAAIPGIPLIAATPPTPALPAALPASGPWNLADENAFPQPWSVLALRVLAHAAVAVTRHDTTTPALDYAQVAHEAALAWGMRYAACKPWDWGAARPLNCATAWHHPLLQHDLFTPQLVPATGDATWAILAEPWRAGEAPTAINYHRGRGQYGWNGALPDNRNAIDASWSGDDAAWNLCARFSPSERCRELVAWAVDWRAYEDAESAPCAPYDASQFTFDTDGVQVSNERAVYPPDATLHWTAIDRLLTSAPADYGAIHSARPECHEPWYKAALLGVYGADRNNNGRWDVGPVPASSRMRATPVARYRFYDRRLIASYSD